MISVVAVLLGLAVGSFLNVVIQRVPVGGSVVRPGSRCPGCGKPISARDNIPLLSYALLRGRCRHCGARIPARYPLVEALTALLFGVAALRFGPSAEMVLALVLVSVCVTLAATDLERRLLPNAVVLPSAAAGFVLSVAATPAAWWTHPLFALGVGGVLLGLATAYPGGMGMGDVKMGAMLGLFLGAYAMMAVFIGALGGALVCGALLASGRIGRGTPLPFGTFMAVGALVALLDGPELWAWYLRLVGAP